MTVYVSTNGRERRPNKSLRFERERRRVSEYKLVLEWWRGKKTDRPFVTAPVLKEDYHYYGGADAPHKMTLEGLHIQFIHDTGAVMSKNSFRVKSRSILDTLEKEPLRISNNLGRFSVPGGRVCYFLNRYLTDI